MNKLNVQSVMLFFVSLLLLTSCLGEARNVISRPAFGVVRYDSNSGLMLLDVNEFESFYAIQFQQTMPGACYWVYFELDYEKAENKNAVERGYFEVDILQREEIDKWEMSYSTDNETSMALYDEVALINPIVGGDCVYIRGMFFMYSSLKIPSDQRMGWKLSYDPQNMMTEDENGKRYYDVFLRSTFTYLGTREPADTEMPNAFNMKTYLEMVAHTERDLNSDYINIRFHYVSEIDGNAVTWNHQDTRPIEVAEILPAE